jgi:hypothetical protein
MAREGSTVIIRNNMNILKKKNMLSPDIQTTNKQKQTQWPLVRKRTIPTDRPPLVDEIQCQLLWIDGCCVVSIADPLQ